MRPWLFGIGIGKTGGHSLAEALRQMGITAKHIGHEVYHGRTVIGEKMRANAKLGCNPVEGITGCEAVVDAPTHQFFRELDEHNKDARFILTYRPPDDCALSWCRMIAANHQSVMPGWPSSYNEYYRHTVDHVDAVLRHFFGRPQKLLILDVRDKDETKWRLLAKFLQRPAPYHRPYPRQFDHQTWQTK